MLHEVYEWRRSPPLFWPRARDERELPQASQRPIALDAVEAAHWMKLSMVFELLNERARASEHVSSSRWRWRRSRR